LGQTWTLNLTDTATGQLTTVSYTAQAGDTLDVVTRGLSQAVALSSNYSAAVATINGQLLLQITHTGLFTASLTATSDATAAATVKQVDIKLTGEATFDATQVESWKLTVGATLFTHNVGFRDSLADIAHDLATLADAGSS